MAIRAKTISGKKYHYLDLSYFVLNKSKTFSKYLGAKKPGRDKTRQLERSFKSEIISKLSAKSYDSRLISQNDLIRALLFREAFSKAFSSLSKARRRKYEIEKTILFTLTTLTTEGVDVSLRDVQNAFEKSNRLNARERISKNMLRAVGSIKESRTLDKSYIMELHRTIMAGFDDKNPGKLRNRQVYLHVHDTMHPQGKEIAYKPPHYKRLDRLLDDFAAWYNSTKLNPVEKAALAHYNLYRIHPFLDGNKRICRLILNKTLLDEGFPLLNISAKKEHYFQSLIDSVEKNAPEKLAVFTLKEFFRQVREFLAAYKAAD